MKTSKNFIRFFEVVKGGVKKFVISFSCMKIFFMGAWGRRVKKGEKKRKLKLLS